MSEEAECGPIAIAIYIPGFGDGGAQVQSARLIQALGRIEGVRLVLIHRYQGPHWAALEGANFTSRQLPTRSNFSPTTALRIRRIVREERIDVVYSWLLSSDIWAGVSRLLGRAGPFWILCERDSDYGRTLAFSLRRFLGRFADGVIANSRPGVQYWREAGFNGPSTVVSNIRPPGNDHAESPEQFDALYVGRLEDQKNVLAVAEAMISAVRLRPSLRFGIVGQGSLRAQIETLLARHDPQGRISLLGYRSDAANLLAGATALITLSHHEGMPNVVIEAVSFGKHVVASNIDEHRALLGPDYPYLVANPSTPETIAQRLVEAIDDTSGVSLDFARNELQRMSPTAVAHEYLKFTRDVLRESRLTIGGNLRRTSERS